MKFLKGLGTFICSFLLFLAISIFSLAYMLHGTVLSVDFVNKQVNKIDISSIARDVAEKQISKELPEQATVLKDVAYDVIAEQEPWIKQQLNSAINTGYDFFLGKSGTLEITVSLVDLKASLSSDLWDAAQKYLQQKLSTMTDRDITLYLQDFINQIPTDILPAELAVLPQNLQEMAIEQYLRNFAGQKPLVNVPPAITGTIESQVKQYFDQYLAEFTSQIKDSYSIDEGTIGSNAMDTLFTVRKYIGYFQAGYYWLIVFMVVMAGLIFLINRNVKVTTRTLGIDLLLFGILDVGGSILARSLSPMKIIPDVSQVPASVQNIIDNVYKDVTSMALTFSIGVLVVGAVLLIVSFIVKSKEAQA